MMLDEFSGALRPASTSRVALASWRLRHPRAFLIAAVLNQIEKALWGEQTRSSTTVMSGLSVATNADGPQSG